TSRMLHATHIELNRGRTEAQKRLDFYCHRLRVTTFLFEYSQRSQAFQAAGPVHLFILSLATEWHHQCRHTRAQYVHCRVVAALADGRCGSALFLAQIRHRPDQRNALLLASKSSKSLPWFFWKEGAGDHPQLRLFRKIQERVSVNRSYQQGFAHQAASGRDHDARCAFGFLVKVFFWLSGHEAGVLNRSLERRVRMKRLFQTRKARIRMDKNSMEVTICPMTCELVMVLIALH